MDDNYEDSTFTIDRFIELSGIRRTIFFKKVKGITGFSPNELIKMKRLNKAAVLLRQGEFTVSEVSYKVGFEDPFISVNVLRLILTVRLKITKNQYSSFFLDSVCLIVIFLRDRVQLVLFSVLF